MCLFALRRGIEMFLKKGVVQKDAAKRQAEYEDQRKLNVELVLKELTMNNNARSMPRKATSVLQ